MDSRSCLDQKEVLFVHETPLATGGSGSNAARKLYLLRAAGLRVEPCHLDAVGFGAKAKTLAKSLLLGSGTELRRAIVYVRLTAASYPLCLMLAGRLPLILELNGYFVPPGTRFIKELGIRRLRGNSTFAGDAAFGPHASNRLGAASYFNLPLGIEAPEPLRGGARAGAVWAGSMIPGQGLRELIDAWAACKVGQVLHLVGDGPLEEALKAQARELAADIEFHGRVDAPSVRRLLQKSEIGIASYERRLGSSGPISSLKTLEYLMCCPKVITVGRDTALECLGAKSREGVFVYHGSGSSELVNLIEEAVASDDVADSALVARRSALMDRRGAQAQIADLKRLVNLEVDRFDKQNVGG